VRKAKAMFRCDCDPLKPSKFACDHEVETTTWGEARKCRLCGESMVPRDYLVGKTCLTCRMRLVLRAVWNEIAGDSIEACGGMMTQSQVIEVVLDFAHHRPDKDVFAVQTLDAMKYVERVAFAKKCFPFKTYGL
jgi:hypothetical protein